MNTEILIHASLLTSFPASYSFFLRSLPRLSLSLYSSLSPISLFVFRLPPSPFLSLFPLLSALPLPTPLPLTYLYTSDVAC